MEGPVKLLQRVRKRVQSVTYGSPIYRLMLDQGPVPDGLRCALDDPWPGDAENGKRLVLGATSLFETGEASPQTRRKNLTHAFLRDLRAVGTESAQRRAATMVAEWLESRNLWDEEGWAPDILGERLANWIAFYAFYVPFMPQETHEALLAGMARQLRHLVHAAPAALLGVGGMHVVRGLVYGGLCLDEDGQALGLGLELLRRQMATEILSDGGTVFRQPSCHAAMAQSLIDVRAALEASRFDVPMDVTLSIARMIPALKALRHGDGGLALFNGGTQADAATIDAIIELSKVKSPVAKRLPKMGYERLTAGRSLVVMDVGLPPPKPYDRTAYAGLLSFEFSHARERIIVNCGAGPEDEGPWRSAMGATAAHSTLVLQDTNACEILAEGGVGLRPHAVQTQRFEEKGAHVIEAAHDGYEARQKTVVHRTISLDRSGEVLRGKEALSGPTKKEFAVRWHLHPDVTALLSQAGDAVLMRLPSGAGWRFRLHDVTAGRLALEPSVYCGKDAPRRTTQIVFENRARGGTVTVEWSLTRERTKKGA